MNSVVTDMYARKERTASSTGNDNVACPVVSTSSGLSYSIDRTGSRLSDTNLESYQQSETSVTACDAAPVTERTCQESTADDDVILIDDINCDGGQHLNTGSTSAPSSSVPTVAASRCDSNEQKLKVLVVSFWYQYRLCDIWWKLMHSI